MKTTLIFDDELTGHHLEYINHLWNAAGSISNENFIFALPRDFEKIKNELNWSNHKNITIHYIENLDENKLRSSLLIRSFYLSKQIKYLANKYKVNNIFLIVLIGALPFIPFLLSKKYKVSGIIYLIYLYRWKKVSYLSRILDLIKYLQLVHCKMFDNIYILNDSVSTKYLNKIYKTNKFKFLPDPIILFDKNKLTDLRSQLKADNKKIVLHFGSMNYNKGTLDIMNAIKLIPEKESSKYCFVFAGKVSKEIYDKFYDCLHELKDKHNITVYDEFCSFEFLGSLCLSCDIILIPYKRTFQSSGVIGYAAQFGKTVIVPKFGLLGKIVKQYKLGILLNETTPDSIISALRKDYKNTINDKYLNINTIENFKKTILNNDID